MNRILFNSFLHGLPCLIHLPSVHLSIFYLEMYPLNSFQHSFQVDYKAQLTLPISAGFFQEMGKCYDLHLMGNEGFPSMRLHGFQIITRFAFVVTFLPFNSGWEGPEAAKAEASENKAKCKIRTASCFCSVFGNELHWHSTFCSIDLAHIQVSMLPAETSWY